MAKKYSGGIILATGFRLDDPQPIDDRLVVTSSNSLTDPNLTNIYPGIIISISGSEGGIYKWNGKDRTNLSNWERILTTSGSISSSGALFFSSSENNSGGLKSLIYDTTTGKVFHTSSLPGGGGGLVNSITNAADNRIPTFTGANSLNGEANLTFDGSKLSIIGNISASSHISSSNLFVSQNITAYDISVNNISASSHISSSNLFVSQNITAYDISVNNISASSHIVTGKLSATSASITGSLIVSGGGLQTNKISNLGSSKLSIDSGNELEIGKTSAVNIDIGNYTNTSNGIDVDSSIEFFAGNIGGEALQKISKNKIRFNVPITASIISASSIIANSIVGGDGGELGNFNVSSIVTDKISATSASITSSLVVSGGGLLVDDINSRVGSTKLTINGANQLHLGRVNTAFIEIGNYTNRNEVGPIDSEIRFFAGQVNQDSGLPMQEIKNNRVQFYVPVTASIISASSIIATNLTLGDGSNLSSVQAAGNYVVTDGTASLTDITASGDISSSGKITTNTLTVDGLSNQGSETTAVMINGSNVVGTRELGSNAFNSTTIGTTTNDLSVDDVTLQLDSGTTFNGSTARTISIKDGGVDSDALANEISLTKLEVTTITASSDISSSATITANSFVGDGSSLTGIQAAGNYVVTDGTASLTNITASGDISSSGTITANSFVGDGSSLTGVTGEWDGSLNGKASITGSLVVSGAGNITASGNISSSGTILMTDATMSSLPTVESLPFFLGVSSSGELIKVNESDVSVGSGTSTTIDGILAGDNLNTTSNITSTTFAFTLITDKFIVAQNSNQFLSTADPTALSDLQNGDSVQIRVFDPSVNLMVSQNFSVTKSSAGTAQSPAPFNSFEYNDNQSASLGTASLLPDINQGGALFKITEEINTGVITINLDNNISLTSITASGDISASGTITANAFVGDGSSLTGVTGEWDGSLNGSASITGSLIVSGAGVISSSELYIGHSGSLTIDSAGETQIKLQDGNSTKWSIANQTESFHRLDIDNSSDTTLFSIHQTKGIELHTSLTASGISASGDITASNLQIDNNINLDGTLSFTGVNFTETVASTISGSTRFGSVASGSDPTDVSHIFPSDINHQFTGSILLTGSGIFPDVSGTIDLGSATQKFTNLFATNTFFGGVHEINLETEGLDQMQEGTILSLNNGILCPCEKEADPLVMGVVSFESNFPIILGAEPILITGAIKEGDYIITSNIKGHGIGVDPKYIYTKQLFGKIIAQAIESGNGESHIIKAMIRKM